MPSARGHATAIALLAALLAAACQGPGGPKVTPPSGGGKKAAHRSPAVGVRTLGAGDVLVAARLIGKVKLISDQGAGVVSNNGGTVIGDAGASLISDKGLGLIANNGGSLVGDAGGSLVGDAGASLIGKTKYRLGQASGAPSAARASAPPTTAAGAPAGASASAPALREAALADAEIEVLDGAGRPLAQAGAPIRLKTDATGAYRYEGQLPAENLVLRVKVHAGGALRGGELRALVPNPGGAEVARELDIDTPATLGATYVLDRFVKNEPGVYAKLPAREVDALKREMGAALRASAEAPAYEGPAIVAAVDALKARVAPLKDALDRIESILLLGQKALGAGKKATEVPLTMPVAVAADSQGDLLLAEGVVGRIRRVAPDGTIAHFAAQAASELGYAVPGLVALRRGPDGALYAVEEVGHRVVRLARGAGPTPVAGNGAGAHGEVGGQALETPLFPAAIAWGPDGVLYISEEAGRAGQVGRVLTVDARGVLGEVSAPPEVFGKGSLNALEVGPDGTIFVAITELVVDEASGRRVENGRLALKRPGAAWETLLTGMHFDAHPDLLWTPEGLLVAEDNGHRIWRLAAADLTKTVFAGTGRSGFEGDGGPAAAAQISEPTGLFRAPDGRVVFADHGNAVYRAIAPDGTITTIAGLRGLYRAGVGEALAVNNPFSLALDPQGQLLILEGAGHVVRRFDGRSLTAVVGGEQGFAGDGGPAAAARLTTPFSIASRDGVLWIADTGNKRIRRVGPDGLIDTVIGMDILLTDKRFPDAAVLPPVFALDHPTGLAIGPDGLPTFCDQGRHQIFKLQADGQVRLLAGPLFERDKTLSGDAGDGGPASAARFTAPVSLVYDQAGNLLIADSANCRVRQIDPAGTITTRAGAGVAGLFAGPAAAEPSDAREVALALPISLALDAAGALYVGELGTRNFKAFGFDGSFSEIAGAVPDLPARIRKITPDGRVTIVAGPGGKVLTDPFSDDALVVPIALLVKPDGSLVVADPGSNQVRLIPKEALQ